MSLDAFPGTRIAVALWLAAFGGAIALAAVSDAWRLHDDALERFEYAGYGLEDRKDRLAHHDELAAELADMHARLAAVERRLPDRLDPAELERTWREQAAAAGVGVASLRLGQEKLEPDYAMLRADLVLEGPTRELLKLVERVRSDVPLKQVVALRIEPGGAAGRLRATLELRVYRYVEPV